MNIQVWSIILSIQFMWSVWKKITVHIWETIFLLMTLCSKIAHREYSMGKLMKFSSLLLTNGKGQDCFQNSEIITELLEVDQLFSILNDDINHHVDDSDNNLIKYTYYIKHQRLTWFIHSPKSLTTFRLVGAAGSEVAISAMSPLPISCQINSTLSVETAQNIEDVDNGESFVVWVFRASV